ncbi:MAG: hypothetical protein M0T85_15725 [Dehalococcoidales bacterium]|nr:hypothetical protein [Dehalococcoidales bacterium]
MSETRALTKYQPITPSVWETIRQIAPDAHQSRLFGVHSPAEASMIMLQGFELGLGLASSFEFIDVIQGKPSLKPRGALALIHNCGLLAGMKIEDLPEACRVWMKRTNGFEYSLTFTKQDAEKAGLVKPDSNWEKYGPNMLRWRCIGFVADVVFPDVLGGMKRADELGADIDREGNVVEGSWGGTAPVPGIRTVEGGTIPVIEEVPVGPKFRTLDELLAYWTPEQIMAANNGQIPGSDAEVAAVAKVLEAGNGN